MVGGLLFDFGHADWNSRRGYWSMPSPTGFLQGAEAHFCAGHFRGA